MSFDTGWDVNKYREEHESEEHWTLRKEFMLQWKNNYPEDRLVCLAQVFVNMELMGCRYPIQVMQEISNLAKEVKSLQKYQNIKKTKLQRTFISAADAVADRVKGIKRVNGESYGPPIKYSKVTFIPQGFAQSTDEVELRDEIVHSDEQTEDRLSHTYQSVENVSGGSEIKETSSFLDTSDESHRSTYVRQYLMDLENVPCLDVRRFRESMFNTVYGRFMLLIRSGTEGWNIRNSCTVCKVPIKTNYFPESERLTLEINGQIVGEAFGKKAIASKIADKMAWKLLREQVITVVVKESWIADGARISTKDVTSTSSDQQFGTPVDNAVATKMMKLMGWSGGGLGADAQGISEPIKPHIRMVNRAGLGSGVGRSGGNRGIRAAGAELMRRFASSDSLDVDLVFSADFSKPERTVLHACAQRQGLASRSYGTGDDRFLVVRKKLDPFSIVRAVVQKGGDTPKYKLFIPNSLDRG